MAISARGKGKGKGKGKAKADEADDVGRERGRRSALDKGKNIVEEEEEEEEEEYVVDEAEEDDSSGEEIKVPRKKRQKRYKEDFELDADDYDVLDDANVKGFRRPAHLGGEFKRLKKAGHVSGRKDSGIVPEEMSEDEGSEYDEEMEDDSSEEELEILSKSQKKGGKGRTSNPRRGVRMTDRSYKPSLGGRRNFDREALAALNEVEMDSDDSDVDDEESLSRLHMEQQYEPSLRETNYNTERANRLLQTDIPERLQILEEETADFLPSSDLESRRVAEWIFDRAFGDLCVPSRPEFQHLLSLEKSEVVRQIANVLRLVHNEKLEVPFIGLYRREECLDLLNEPKDWNSSFEEGPKIQEYKALWAIQEWNKKWLLIQRRKSVLQVNLKERIPVDINSTPEKDSIAKSIFRFLEEAESEQAIDDCEAQFNLHFPIDESEVADCGFKRPRFRSLYSSGHQAGLGKITKYFGLTSEAFGDNVKAGYKRNGILDEAFLPDDLAAQFFKANTSKAEFRDPASLIRGARHMLAMEISTEPLVREHVRSFYLKNALVNTRPTPAGIDAIGTFHQFDCVKWIIDKQISAFDDEQWLLIQKAEEEKLIDVTVALSKESIDSILFDFDQLFSSDGLGRTSPTWSEQRKLILQEAIVTLLLPLMEKETRMSLVVRAKQVLAAKCGLQLWNKVSVAPPKVSDLDCRDEDGPALRVLACCWGPPNVGTTFVMLDADGEIMYTMRAGYLNIKSVSSEQIQRKENDQARLMQVLLNYKPHFIVLGAARVQCRYLGLNISDILFKFAEQHGGDAGDSSGGLDSPKLVYGDEFIPSLFEASSISRFQLPGQPGDVRRAVALGRFLQNPVAMVASLCNRPSMEVRSIKFHPLQSFLSDEELDDIIERVMVTVVNQVGIDINLALIHDWLFETLQFVAGLGPLKACEVRRTVQMVKRVLTRDNLYTTIRAMNEKVFTNSAGFIRVREIGQTSSDLRPSEPLDNTRIHPEWYQMAKNLAEAALEKEAKPDNEEVDDDVPNMVVERVMKNPNALDSVDIEEYAQSVHVEGQSKRVKTLELIKSELQRGFQEWRRSYSEPSQEECFYLMTGESEETLFEGRILQATVRRVEEHQLMCVLECGLLGFIQKEDVSDDGDVELKDKFTEGSSVTCRVKEVKKDKYLVDLTCKESDLREDSKDDLHHRDKRSKTDTDNTLLLNEQEKTRLKKEEYIKKTFRTRPIVHPKFENLSTDDAIKMLAEKDLGDFIIHPSSKGPAHLAIALKISDGLFSHIDIAEGGKENWDLASFLRLGKTLTIGDDSYKSLDEVISKHVDVIVIHMNAILQYRKYKQGNKSEIADALRSEKAEKPKCIPYCISIAHEYPGAFMLSYIRATNCYHEYISLVPSGFRFRRKLFDTIEKVVVYFQTHFHDPAPEPPSRGKGRGGEKDGKGVCYAFQRGDCSNGASCKFLHEKREERPRGVCYAFQRGECNDGDDCKFLHEKQEERPRGVCYSFQRGDCTNGDDCKFLHEKQEERPRRVCYSFQRGDCTNGDDCKFLHEKRDESVPEVCRAFQRGDCPRGDSCRYVHDKQDGGRPREACRAFQRGDCSRGDGCRFAHAEQGDGSMREAGSGTNRTTNSNGGHSDWNNGTANENWGDEGDAKGKDDWNDAAGGGSDSAWGGKGISSNTEAEADGWGATNAAGGGSDSAWGGEGISSNTEAEADGWGATNAAAGGGSDSAWGDKGISSNTEAKADGWGATNAAGGGSDSAWGDKGISSNTEAKADGWGATNAAGGGSDSAWGDKGISSNTEAEADGWGATNAAAGGGSDSAWGDKGVSSNTEAEADGWGATNAAGGGGGGGWDDWDASTDGGAGGPANAASKGGGWDSPADGGGTNAATGDGGAAWGVTAEKEDNVWGGTSNAAWSNGDKSKSSHEKQEERPRGVCYGFQRGDCSNGDSCRFLHEKQEERPRGVCYGFQRGDCSNGDGCRFLHEKQEERPRRVCYGFQRGDCSNGDGCRFLHEKQEERPRGVCYAFQRGDCSNGDDCRFLHEKQEERPRGVCYAFQRGDCSRGNDCRYLHEKRDESVPEVCRAFQRGDCPRGDSCRYVHDKQDGGRPREACRAFQRGDCPRGDSCRFAHDKQEPREACRAFQRGDCSRGDGCRFAHAEQGGDGAGSGMNRRNENWGGNTNDAKGKDDWNDAAGTGLNSSWGDKGKSSNTGAEADGWGTSNAAGGGWGSSPTGAAATNAASGDGGGGWGDNPEKEDNAWSGTANVASGSGGWGSSPTRPAATNAASGDGGGGWGDNTGKKDNAWSGTANAASGSGGWGSSPTRPAATNAASGDGGGGWGENPGKKDNASSGTTNVASGSGGWGSSPTRPAATNAASGDGGGGWGDNPEKEDNASSGTANAATGSGGWNVGQGEGDKSKGKDAWDAGTKSTGEDDGWG